MSPFTFENQPVLVEKFFQLDILIPFIESSTKTEKPMFEAGITQ